MSNIDRYTQFIESVTSEESMSVDVLVAHYKQLKAAGCNIARLDTGATGLVAESGEIMEIVKKIKFQGKEFNEDTKYHLLRELGDVLFYYITTIESVGVTFDDVMQANIDKLSARYPGGFSVERSEVREEGDI